jgi:hypothetical protein
MTPKTTNQRRYRVAGNETLYSDFGDACVLAVSMAVSTHESVAIETLVGGKVVEHIDVTAALSIDDPDHE